MVTAPSAAEIAVTVLIPVYNCAPYLRESLESLVQQTLTNFEVILVNDGSTDQSADIAQEFADKDSRFRIHHQVNQGIVAALNNGLALARGKYLARLDGDDLAHPNRLQHQVQHMENNPGCVCVGSLYRAIDEKGTVTWVQKVFANLRQTNLSIFPPHVATLPHPSITLRTAQLQAMGGYRSQFPHAEDYDLFLRLSQKGTLDIVPEHLLDYRFHASSLSSKNLMPQVDSAVMAVWSALARERGDADPADGEIDLTLAYVSIQLHGANAKQLLMHYREFRVIGAWMNRGNFSAAKNHANSLFLLLGRNFPHLVFETNYWHLWAAAAKLRLKIALGRI